MLKIVYHTILMAGAPLAAIATVGLVGAIMIVGGTVIGLYDAWGKTLLNIKEGANRKQNNFSVN